LVLAVWLAFWPNLDFLGFKFGKSTLRLPFEPLFCLAIILAPTPYAPTIALPLLPKFGLALAGVKLELPPKLDYVLGNLLLSKLVESSMLIPVVWKWYLLASGFLAFAFNKLLFLEATGFLVVAFIMLLFEEELGFLVPMPFLVTSPFLLFVFNYVIFLILSGIGLLVVAFILLVFLYAL